MGDQDDTGWSIESSRVTSKFTRGWYQVVERVRVSEMFKKFTTEENISSTSQIKNSVQRAIQSSVCAQYPKLETIIDEILPKKSMMISKCQDKIELVSVNGEVLFFNHHGGPYFPTMKLLHRFPTIMPIMQVDKGAIKFVLSGANIMCPGFTSPGGNLPDEVETGRPVAIFAEGKQHPLAVGLTQMSSSDIKEKNKGIAVENVHFLLDGLWCTKSI